jgi:hypothetical protein
MGWWTDLKGLGNVVKEQANTAIPRDFGEFVASVVGGPIGITEYKKSKAVGNKADEVEAYQKKEKRRAAIERAMGGNPLGRQSTAPKALDMTPWASHDVAQGVMQKFF